MYSDPHSRAGTIGHIISMELFGPSTLDTAHQPVLLEEPSASTVARQDIITEIVELLGGSEVDRPQLLIVDSSSKELRRMDHPRRLAEFTSLVLTKSRMVNLLCRVCS